MENFSVLFEPLALLEEKGSLLMDLWENYKEKEQKKETSFWRSHNPPGSSKKLEICPKWAESPFGSALAATKQPTDQVRNDRKKL